MALIRNPLADEQASLVTVSLVVIASVAIAFSLAYTRPVLVPFVLSVFVYYLVSPVADILELRLRVPRWASTILVILLVAGGIFLLGLLILTSARGLTDSADIYREKLIDLAKRITDWLDRRGLELSQDALVDSMRNLPVSRLMAATAETAFTIITNGTLVLLFVIFLLLGRSRQMIKSLVFRQIDRDIRRYLVIKFLISGGTGILVWLILTAFGLELALVFGVLTFFLNFIPSIGSIIATMLPIPIALVQFDTLGPVIAIFVLVGIVQVVIGNGIDPMLMGQNLNLSPVTIVMALVFWGLLWGVVGMLLAAPLTAILRIVLAQFETTRPMSELMAGRLPDGGYVTAETPAVGTNAVTPPAVDAS
jgi:AI-2 transport protein TqsA